MHLDQFLETRSAFSNQELTAFLESSGASAGGIQKESVIRRWKRSGWIQSVRNGAYIVTRNGDQDERAMVLQAACGPRPDCVLGYQAALAYHLGLPLPKRIRVLTRAHLSWSINEPGGCAKEGHDGRDCLKDGEGKARRNGKNRKALYEFLPVRLSPSSEFPGRFQWGVVQPDPSSSFRVTNLERSLVDVFDRPDFFDSIGEFRDLWIELERPDTLDKLAVLDLKAVSEYLRMIDCATTTAKVGYFLEGHWEKLHVSASLMRSITRPSFEAIWDRSAAYGRGSSRWNLVLPLEIMELEKKAREGNKSERVGIPYTGNLKESLKGIFGHDAFRAGQEDLIRAVLEGQDAMGNFPTGAGKSLAFQLPAKLLEGVTIVISPLLSLMMDQVEEAKERKIKARTINSMTTAFQRDRTFDLIVAGKLDLLFLAPESIKGLIRILQGLHRHVRMIVIDEAHCIHDWGKGFRPDYRKLEILSQLFNVPKMLLTATANDEVRADILNVMEMRNICLRKLSSFRRNLYLAPTMMGRDRRFPALLHFVKTNQNSGIIYCRSRPSTEEIAERLCKAGIKAKYYHAQISKRDKSYIQVAFKKNEIDVIVATTAFGMGINKSNVRWVVHMHPPMSVSDYIQQIGRAGRDGKHAKCIIMYADTEMSEMMKSAKKEADEEIRIMKMKQIDEMHSMLSSKTCRHQLISRYFGEEISPCKESGHGSCDICNPKLKPRLPSVKDEMPPRHLKKRKRPKMEKSQSHITNSMGRNSAPTGSAQENQPASTNPVNAG